MPASFDLGRVAGGARIVVAMSGGVDSSVVAALAAGTGAEEGEPMALRDLLVLTAVREAVARALDPAGDRRFAIEHRGPQPGADGRPRWFRSVGRAGFVAEAGRRASAGETQTTRSAVAIVRSSRAVARARAGPGAGRPLRASTTNSRRA